jgi:hypothetical protein
MHTLTFILSIYTEEIETQLSNEMLRIHLCIACFITVRLLWFYRCACMEAGSIETNGVMEVRNVALIFHNFKQCGA